MKSSDKMMVREEIRQPRRKRQEVNNMTFGQMLKKLMEERNLKTSDLSHATGIPYTTLDSIIKRDTKHVKLEIAFKLASYFNSTLEEMVGSGMVRQNTANTEHKGVRIPVFYEVLGLKSDYAKENIRGYEMLPAELTVAGEYFGLVIRDNSMAPRIRQGDIALVHRQTDVENTQIAVVCIGDEPACVRKFIKHPGGVTLIAFDPQFEPISLTREKAASQLRILGRVVELRSKL